MSRIPPISRPPLTLTFAPIPRIQSPTPPLAPAPEFLLKKRLQARCVRDDDSDFQLNRGDDDQFSEDPCEVGKFWIGVEFEEDREADARDYDDDEAEGEEEDEAEAFAERDLDGPEGADGEEDDDYVEGYGLVVGKVEC